MQQLSLSIFNRTFSHGDSGDSGKFIQPLLDAFETQHNIHVDLEIMQWQTGWAKFVEMAIYGRGPDLSEVGSTWVADLARMNALKSYSPLDIKLIGNQNDFITANWQAGVTSNHDDLPVVWGIPWAADVRVMAYRRDFLEKAKIDINHAFKNIEELNKTIAALKADGFELPISFATLRSNRNVHQMASWIWAYGGDFMTDCGKRIAFDSPKALQGMRSFFELGQYIPTQYHKISEDDIDPIFISGKAALLFSGSWLVGTPGLDAIQTNVDLIPIPGGSFTGGSHMVTWKHSRKQDEALLLLDFLIKHSAEYKMFPAFGLPAYTPDWTGKTQFLEEPYFSAFYCALQNGKAFPTSELWGMVEKRLADITPIIWERIFASDNPDIDQILAETIVPLARMLNLSLET